MEKRASRLAASVGVLMAAAALTGSAQPPTFRAGVNFVRVDAIVADKQGAFVPALTSNDFEVSEQGKIQKIETFKMVTLDGGLMPGPDGLPRAIHSDDDELREAARDDVRLFGVFLDDYHVSREASIQVRDRLAAFVSNDLGTSDMIALMRPLTPLSSLLLTRDHEAVETGIKQFLGRKGEYDPLNPAEVNLYRQYFDKPGVMEQVRNQVAYTAFSGFITHLSAFKEARKTLILVTEGFAGGLRDLDVQELYTEANRGNVSIYWIDPRMLNAWAPGVGEWLWDEMCECLKWKPGPVSVRSLTLQQDPLKAISLYTDGRAFITNDLANAMKSIVRDTSGYYLLGYNSTFTGADGKFHEIHVRVKRAGVSVRARKGYWALSRDELASATAARPAAVPAPIEDAFGKATAVSAERFVRTWVGAERGENGRTRVAVVWEPVPPATAGGGASQSIAVARVIVTAAGADGQPASPATGVSTSASGREAFDALPGRLRVRLLVYARDNGVLDTETRDVVVPDFTAPHVALSTPKLFRARTPREVQQIEGDPEAAPFTGREFVRTDRIVVRIAAYAPGAARSTLAIHVLGRTGQKIADIPLTHPASTGPAQDAEIPLAAFAAGEYVLEITAAGEDAEARELVGFRVM